MIAWDIFTIISVFWWVLWTCTVQVFFLVMPCFYFSSWNHFFLPLLFVISFVFVNYTNLSWRNIRGLSVRKEWWADSNMVQRESAINSLKTSAWRGAVWAGVCPLNIESQHEFSRAKGPTIVTADSHGHVGFTDLLSALESGSCEFMLTVPTQDSVKLDFKHAWVCFINNSG